MWPFSRGSRKPNASLQGYEGASTSGRLRQWRPGNTSINTDLFWGGEQLRSRSRDMARRNGWAQNAIEKIVSNAIGTGIKPQLKLKDAALKAEIQQLFLDWTDEADADGLVDFYGLQSLITRAVVEGGECFVRFRPRRPEDGLSVPLQLQVLEAEQLATQQITGGLPGNTIRAGIEFNKIGKRIAYHLYRSHPGDVTVDASTIEIVRVPAEEVLHIYKPLRPGQIRGEPWLARTLVTLNELDQYEDAELVRKKTAAMFMGFITQKDPESDPLGIRTDGDGADAAPYAEMEAGSLQVLAPDEDIKFAEPADVGSSYLIFIQQQLRYIAASMGITYEQLSGDLTGVNYSSIRAGLIEFRRSIAAIQNSMVIFQFCRPVYQRWLDTAVLSEALPLSARAYQNNRRVLQRCNWIAQGWEWVDPLKDQQAELLAVRSGFKSRSEVVSEQGYDAEDVDDQIAADNARADGLGLVFDSDPRKVAKTGVMQPIVSDDNNRQE